MAHRRFWKLEPGLMVDEPRSGGLCPCGKRGFRSSNQAKAAHARARFRFRTYWCPEGNTWHVTASEKR